ncbi:hypothetical protein FIBSPDRAFT_354519 [Athelia psychrophila]|uniref:Uncharacterized protein n=1 Tax=Athelia psychrophila TaxID=1759441 RepID=A0A167VU64_9AGAM|nr:hypothetical protein FIBSPDRAFT_354519 [Fibularhizoctonia sp. CBS 109695]
MRNHAASLSRNIIPVTWKLRCPNLFQRMWHVPTGGFSSKLYSFIFCSSCSSSSAHSSHRRSKYDLASKPWYHPPAHAWISPRVGPSNTRQKEPFSMPKACVRLLYMKRSKHRTDSLAQSPPLDHIQLWIILKIEHGGGIIYRWWWGFYSG